MAADAVLCGSGSNAGAAFTTATGVNAAAGDTLVFTFDYDPSRTISSATLSNGDTLTQIANVTSGTGRLAAYIKENCAGGTNITATATLSGAAFATGSLIKATGVAAASYDATSLATGTDAATPYTINSGSFAQANNVVIVCFGQNAGNVGAYASSNFTILGSNSDTDNFWTHCIAKLVVTSTSAVTPSLTRANSTNTASPLIVFGLKEAAAGGGISIPVVHHHRMRNF